MYNSHGTICSQRLGFTPSLGLPPKLVSLNVVAARALELALALLLACGAEGWEASGGEGDVFDPRSWDADTRRAWNTFVSSSKVGVDLLPYMSL